MFSAQMETEDGKSTEKEELGWEQLISSDRLANHERTENAGRKHYTASSHGGCPWQAVISRSHILCHCAPVTGGNSAKGKAGIASVLSLGIRCWGGYGEV